MASSPEKGAVMPLLPRVQHVAGRTSTSALTGDMRLRLPPYRVVRHTLMAMPGGGNRYPQGSVSIDCQSSELNRGLP